MGRALFLAAIFLAGSIACAPIAEIRLYHAGEVPANWEQNNPSGLIAIKTK